MGLASGRESPQAAENASFARRRAFLESGAAWPGGDRPECIETHASLVFLTPDRAWKIKKPVDLPHIDLRALEAREHFCREELRINRELAGAVYRSVKPLRERPDGSLAIGGDGRVVDWLIEMERLPAGMMLDLRIASGPPVRRQEIEALCDVLIGFYAGREVTADAGEVYFARLLEQSAFNAKRLRDMRSALETELDDNLLEAAQTGLETHRSEILSRGERGLVVEGHGDLRPDHVCLIEPPVVFDRIEFDHGFRLIDVFDEFNTLGLECAIAGERWIGPALLSRLERSGRPIASPSLMTLYGLNRCLTRARLAIDHLRDAEPRTPEVWPVKARRYLDAAARLFDGAGPGRNE